MDYDKAAAAIAGKCVFEESKRALIFPKDDEKTGEERKEKKGKEEDQERNEVSASGLVPQETMEQSSNRVMGDMVNILVQGLDGRHLSMRVAQGTRVSVLCMDLVSKAGIPRDAFYLTRQAKVLQNDEELWLEQDERFCMRGRLRGGMDGDWTCQHCGRQGCWVTKVRCYRCGKSKYDPPNHQPMDGNPNIVKLGNRLNGNGPGHSGCRGRIWDGWATFGSETSSASAATAATESKAESSGSVEGSFSCPRGGVV